MRTSWIVIATAALGLMFGLGLTYLEMSRVGDRFANATGTQGPEIERVPRVTVVGEREFDFGTLQKDRNGTCIFKIRNDGEGPLDLSFDGVSCGLCIHTTFEHAVLKHGEELVIEVNYTTHKEGPHFAEYLEVRTDDPDEPMIRFDITGYVTRSIRFSKREINLGNIATDEDVSTSFRIYGYTDHPIEITDKEFITKPSVDYFSLELTEMELDEFKDDEPRAKSAIQVKLKMAQGRPLGPIKQVLRVTAKLGERTTTAEIVIRATVVSDISLFGGRDFSKERSLVQFGSILGTVDHSTTLRIRIRGPFRDKVKLSIVSIDPENVMKATIGEPTVAGNGILYPLTISIPKGAPPINRLGSQQGRVGVIKIETTHPTAKHLPVYVSFAIE